MKIYGMPTTHEPLPERFKTPLSSSAPRPSSGGTYATIHYPEEARRPASDRGLASQGELPSVYGIGLNFNLLTRFSSPETERWKLDRFGKVAVIVKPGAFDSSLRLVNEGIREIRLLLAHDNDLELISTADRSFKVWADHYSLHWYINPVTARGRKAAMVVAGSKLRECSVGYRGFTPDERYNGSFWRTTDMNLEEISLVVAGANPGTRLELLY